MNFKKNQDNFNNNLEGKISNNQNGSSVKNYVRAGAYTALGITACANAYAQKTQKEDITKRNTTDKPVQKKIHRVPVFEIISPDKKLIKFNTNIGPMYDQDPTFIVYTNANDLREDYESGTLGGIDSIAVRVATEDMSQKMNYQDLGDFNTLLKDYLSNVLNNQDNGRVKGEIDRAELRKLFRIMRRTDNESITGFVVERWNSQKEDNGSGFEYAPIVIRGKSIKIQKYNSTESCNTCNTCDENKDDTKDKTKDSNPPNNNNTALHLGGAFGYNFADNMMQGQFLPGIKYGKLDIMLPISYGQKKSQHVTSFPNADNNGSTDIIDETTKKNFGAGLGIGYFVAHDWEVMAMIEKIHSNSEINQIIKQSVRDALGNYKSITLPGSSCKNTESHYNLGLGIAHDFESQNKTKYGLYTVADFNLKTRKVEDAYLGLRVTF